MAEQFGISREQMDALAAESHRRAASAIAAGYFKEQIVPVVSKGRKGDVVFDTDEHVKAATTVETLAAMRTAFKKDGTVTAGNASGLNDGAGGSRDGQRRGGKKPRPQTHGTSGELCARRRRADDHGHRPRCRPHARRWPVRGLTVSDLDVIESNEAFAAQACAVVKELGLDPAKTNPNGSGISLGHPIGATGAIIATKAIYELHRTGGCYALVTMCIGGGQGIAAIFERV